MAVTKFSLLRLAAAPAFHAVSGQKLQFERDTLIGRQLDQVPQAVVAGFEAALESPNLQTLTDRVELIRPEHVGFAYEGAAMALTITDVAFGTRRLAALLEGPSRQHLFLAYIGVGFALARLPRPTWRRLNLDLDIPPYHPALSWLVVDGYGFDLAYFNHRRLVRDQWRPKTWPWLGESEYFHRAIDQGIGRALWFIDGADITKVRLSISRFPHERHADLWSGVALAATFAGPLCATGAEQLLEACHDTGLRNGVLIGASLAAKARDFSGVVPQHSRDAARWLTGLDITQLAHITDLSQPKESTRPGLAYSEWRQNIAETLR